MYNCRTVSSKKDPVSRTERIAPVHIFLSFPPFMPAGTGLKTPAEGAIDTNHSFYYILANIYPQQESGAYRFRNDLP